MSTIRANLDVTQYVRVTSDPLKPSALLLQSHRDTVRIAFSDTKPAKSNTVYHELGGEHSPLHVPMTEQSVWALAMTERSALTVTEQRVPVEVSNRDDIGVAVFISDQTTNTLSVPLLQDRAVLTLASTAAVGLNVIEVETGHGVVAGEVIELAKADGSLFMQSEVVSVVTNTITLDSPLNTNYVVADDVLVSSKNLLVDGSVTPQVFSVLPLSGQAGDIVRIIVEIRGAPNLAMDFTSFGSDNALTNGVVVRVNNGDGTYKNLFNFKSNSDVIQQGFDHEFLDPKGGNLVVGFTARVTWGGPSKHGVVIRLEGSLGQALELVVQDDLSATNNTRFNVIAQGHELQE